MNTQASALFVQAGAAYKTGDMATAASLLERAVAVDARAHEAWNALAEVAVRRGDAELGAVYARRALQLQKRNPVYLNVLGVACGEILAYDEAESALRRALKIKPVYPEAVFNLGKVLRKQGRTEEALREYERAYAMAPELPRLRLALAAFLRRLGRGERAAALLADGPDRVPDAYVSSYAQCLLELQGACSAARWLEARMQALGESRELRFFLAGLFLASGRWERGWKLYADRPSVERAVGASIATLPRSLAGERILLRAEQGLGDVLFFLRFAAELRDRGAQVALCGPRRLFPLLHGLDFLDEDAPYDEASFNRVLWLGDLPAMLQAIDTPNAVTVAVDERLREDLARRLAALGPPPYLGVTWRAGTEMLRRQEFADLENVLSKETPPELLGSAIRGWPGTVVAVQRLPRDDELAALRAAADCVVHDLSALNEDLASMVALLAALHEYVGVSNTNMHLMAGIGRSARVLVPQPYEWRWMEEGESLWFPGFSVYRQPATRDWSAPLAGLRAELFP